MCKNKLRASVPSLLLSHKHLHLQTSLSSSQLLLPPPGPQRSPQPLPRCWIAWARPRSNFARPPEGERRWGPREKEGALRSHVSSFCTQISRLSLDPRPDTSLLRPVVASYSDPSSSPQQRQLRLQHSSSVATFTIALRRFLVEDAFGCGRRRLFSIHSSTASGQPAASAHH